MPFFPQFSNLFVAPYIPYTPTNPINPDEISGLSLWLKSDTGITLDGSLVTNWSDQSGNGNDAYVLNSGEEPTYQTNVINGLPIVSFDGAIQVLQIDSSSSLNVSALSVFFVLAKDGNGSGNDIVFIKNGSIIDDPAVYGIVASSSSNWSASYNPGGGWTDHGSGFSINNDSNFHIIGYCVDVDNSFSFQDNASTNDLFATGTIQTTTGTLQIGGYNQSFENPDGEFFYGRIAEIIIYNNVISGSDRDGLMIYLNNRYEIY